VIPEERIKKAIDIICQHGAFGGEDHKAWTLDQVLRTLMTENQYDQFTTAYNGDATEAWEKWPEGKEP